MSYINWPSHQLPSAALVAFQGTDYWVYPSLLLRAYPRYQRAFCRVLSSLAWGPCAGRPHQPCARPPMRGRPCREPAQLLGRERSW
eukprot:4402151-Prymnesium_polylepis.1